MLNSVRRWWSGEREVSVGEISALYVYPIKSCRGLSVPTAEIDGRGRGFVGDRMLMLVDGDRRFLSQRRAPRMATIVPRFVSPEDIEVTADAADKALRVAIAAEVLKGKPKVEVSVWGDTCEAVDMGDEAATWFQEVLGFDDVRLVRIRDEFQRAVEPEYTQGDEFETGFADGYPFLLATEESLAALNSALPDSVGPVPMTRFRPNIVVRGSPGPWSEDSWARVTTRDCAGFRVCKICERCRQIRVDQETGETHGAEPSETLGRIRGDRHGGKVVFGQNLVAESASCGATLSVGDIVTAVTK